MLIHSWCNEPASCVVMLVHCASCVVKVRALLGRSAPDPQKLVPMPTPRSWNPRRQSKPSGTSGFWWEMPCLRSMCLRVCVVVDVTKPLLQLISVYFVRCKELPFCSFSCSLLGHTSMVWPTPMEQDQVGNGKLPWNDDRAWPLVFFFLEKGNFIYFKHNTSRWYIVLKFSRPLSERHTA